MRCRNQGSARAVKSAVVVLLMAGLMWTGGDATAGGNEWGYYSDETKGPNTWKKTFGDCGGSMQSPIDIATKDAVYDVNLHDFDFSDYSKTEGIKMALENKQGHTAEVHVSGTPIYIKDGSLPAPYVLRQFHFHWGQNNSRGSEHSIDGNFSPMEVHFVHSQERFNDISVAAKKPFGLAVLAFFFQVGSKNNEKFAQLIENLSKIPDPNNEAEIETFPVKDLLPSTDFNYYRYQGSLTTPPCTESVIWTIAFDPISISREQLEIFRSLRDNEHHNLVDDYRPIQALNNRTVLTTQKKQ